MLSIDKTKRKIITTTCHMTCFVKGTSKRVIVVKYATDIATPTIIHEIIAGGKSILTGNCLMDLNPGVLRVKVLKFPASMNNMISIETICMARPINAGSIEDSMLSDGE